MGALKRLGVAMSDTVTFKSVEREGWEERADLYDSYTARLTSPAIEALLDAAQISSGQAVLDVCCGTGLASAAAAARGCQVTGVDFSPAMIETARRKQVEAEFEVGDAEELPFPDASFDCVITNYGHYHLPDPDRAIKEAARVLNGHYPDSCRPATMTMALALPRTREMTFRRLQIPNQRKRAIKRAPESRRAR